MRDIWIQACQQVVTFRRAWSHVQTPCVRSHAQTPVWSRKTPNRPQGTACLKRLEAYSARTLDFFSKSELSWGRDIARMAYRCHRHMSAMERAMMRHEPSYRTNLLHLDSTVGHTVLLANKRTLTSSKTQSVNCSNTNLTKDKRNSLPETILRNMLQSMSVSRVGRSGDCFRERMQSKDHDMS